MAPPSKVLSRHAPFLRLALYLSIGLWSFLLFIFTLVRLIYTTRRRSDRSLFNGNPFYDPSVVELMVCSILGGAFSAFMVWSLRRRQEHESLSRNWFELVCLFVLWMLWIGGAGAATNVWPDLSFCIQFSPCRVLQALMAWAWLGWISISSLLLPTVWIVATSRQWDQHFFDTWGSYRHSEILSEFMFEEPKLPAPAPAASSEFRSQRTGLGSWLVSRKVEWGAQSAHGTDLPGTAAGSPGARPPTVSPLSGAPQETRGLPSVPPTPPARPGGALRLATDPGSPA